MSHEAIMSDHPNPNPRKLYGLLLAGGQSRRMGRDKAALPTDEGVPLWLRTFQLLKELLPESYVSLRPGQTLPQHDAEYAPVLVDRARSTGPLSGILTALASQRDTAWFVLACDLPLLDKATLQFLLENRQQHKLATAYRSARDGLPEPLCAIYEPAAYPRLKGRLAEDRLCPQKFLIESGPAVNLLDLPEPNALERANTPMELERIEALKNI